MNSRDGILLLKPHEIRVAILCRFRILRKSDRPRAPYAALSGGSTRSSPVPVQPIRLCLPSLCIAARLHATQCRFSDSWQSFSFLQLSVLCQRTCIYGPVADAVLPHSQALAARGFAGHANYGNCGMSCLGHGVAIDGGDKSGVFG